MNVGRHVLQHVVSPGVYRGLSSVLLSHEKAPTWKANIACIQVQAWSPCVRLCELLIQVKREMLHKSQELPHESLATMLADYGDGPASALMQAAFHPNPIRRIDLELPPSAAALRRSIEAQARAEVVAGAARGHAAAAGGLRSNNLLGSSGSAVDLLESLLQHGRGAAAASASAAAAAGGHGSGYGVGRSASMPAAGAEGGCPPGWLGSVPLGGAVNLRGSMLAAESTFIFPAGLQAPAAGGAGADEAELGASSSTAAEEGGDLGGDSTGVAPWDAWQQQQQVLPSRHITSAPGYLSSRAGEEPTGTMMRLMQVANIQAVLPAFYHTAQWSCRKLASTTHRGNTRALTPADRFLLLAVVLSPR